MSKVTQFFSSRKGIISAGIFVGIFAPLLQKWGNPGNMGICVACMERDIAGALGLHRAAPVQYIRPEITGFVLGALVAALLFKEFKPRGGSSPIIRFFLGFFAMVGALVFSWMGFHLGLVYPFLVAGGLLIADAAFSSYCFRKAEY